MTDLVVSVCSRCAVLSSGGVLSSGCVLSGGGVLSSGCVLGRAEIAGWCWGCTW